MIDNKLARRNYTISETVTAGLVLTGAEVKTLRLGRGSLKDAHAKWVDNALVLIGCDIPQYSHFAGQDYDAKRSRLLLLNKSELLKLKKKMEGKPLTLVPLRLFFAGRWVKCELGLGKGKKDWEKREDIKKRDIEKEIAKSLRN